MLLYSLLYLYGFNGITLEDIKSFRQYGSKAAGHPECRHTPGVEVTTGALGQGICNAVGMALAEAHLAGVYNKPGFSIVDHYVYCVVGDGCLMEGISAEACALAGHWRLGKLIVLYDDNEVSIEGGTDLAFSEHVIKRFRAQNWHTIEVRNGNTDLGAIYDAIREAKDETTRPSLIKISTTIGYGCVDEGTSKMHGACLDVDSLATAKKRMNWGCKPFEIPAETMKYARRKVDEGAEYERCWRELFAQYAAQYPLLGRQFETQIEHGELPTAFYSTLERLYSAATPTNTATRKLSGKVLNTLSKALPHLLGGSADLAPSTCTHLRASTSFTYDDRSGRNVHFGVREHGMGCITNGMALHSNLQPFCATFLVFCDYMRAAVRTAALSNAPSLFVFTHDSAMIGQDGPTHAPVEQLASLRAMPGLYVIRPADEVEVIAGYEWAVGRRDGPCCIVLSRQDVRCGKGDRKGAMRGGYVFSQSGGDNSNYDRPDVTLIATGSEVGLCEEARVMLERDGVRVRVVSMPCREVFEMQDEAYKASVVDVRERCVVVEAGTRFGWEGYASRFVSIEGYSVSAPESVVRRVLGMDAQTIVGVVRSMMIGG